MLTIYIPTYNRVKHLQLLLESLFLELDENPSISSCVIIKVFNNRSSDDTEEYLNSIARDNLLVFNRIGNIGARANVADGIHHCDTEYLWILGDDDIPYRGLLAKIVHLLQELKPDLLYLPAVWSANIFEKPMPSVENGLVVEKKNAEQFIKMVGVKLTFISSFVFSFDHYSSLKNNSDVLMARETDFPHLAFFSPAVLSGEALFVINDVVVRATGNSNFQYSLLQSFGVDLPNAVKEIFAINKILSDLFIRNLLVAFLPSFLYSIRFGSSKSFDKDIPWASLRSALGDHKAFWFFVYPLKFLPKFLALPLVVLGRLFR
jgi:glycosyltransferase involved in cell wall biosynthesis